VTAGLPRPLAGLRVLMIEDVASLRMVYRSYLIHAGAEVRVAATAAEGVSLFRQWPAPVVVLDIGLPDRDGIDLIHDLTAERPDVRIVVITVHGGVNRAVAAMRAGAHDFLTKPFDEDRLIAAIRNAADSMQMPRRRLRVRADGAASMIGASPQMTVVAQALSTAAPSMAPVVIWGGPGSGKDLAARLLHAMSVRGKGRFVRIDCGKMGEEDLSRKLFGVHGALVAGDEGTLYLAQIQDLPPRLQARLMEALVKGQVRGGDGPARSLGQMRLIAGLGMEPVSAVRDGKLRSDLLMRLDVVNISLPDLKDRGRDAADIANVLLPRLASEAGKGFETLAPEVAELFCHLPWPGNVRDLIATLKHVVTHHDGSTVTLDNLPRSLVPPVIANAMLRPEGLEHDKNGPDFAAPVSRETAARQMVGLPLIEVERLVIEATIQAHDGSLPRAARALGLAPSTLYRKRQAWLDPPGAETP
jgi:two-component system, repressor protein LuxO